MIYIYIVYNYIVYSTDAGYRYVSDVLNIILIFSVM